MGADALTHWLVIALLAWLAACGLTVFGFASLSRARSGLERLRVQNDRLLEGLVEAAGHAAFYEAALVRIADGEDSLDGLSERLFAQRTLGVQIEVETVEWRMRTREEAESEQER